MTGKIFSKNWETMKWSKWIPLNAPHKVFRQLTTKPGVYRVRAVELDILVYIGQTGRSLRGRLNALRRNIYGTIMPYNDPHTAAPNLWAWYQENKYQYECSVASVILSKPNRQALEDMLLWQHRILTGKSTLCNYGRFHHRYIKSRNSATGFRGYKLPANEYNTSGGRSTAPLNPLGMPHGSFWMELSWSPAVPLDRISLRKIPSDKGLYKIVNSDKNRILYVGETKNLRDRCRSHLNKDWNGKPTGVSYFTLNEELFDYQVRELEADLIGCYYSIYGEAPPFQYGR
ncbi:GIY-YIG nuclease family protein [Thermodesulfobacteriota bacterium]